MEAYFYVSYPDCDKETYAALFSRLREAELTETVAEALLTKIKRSKDALKLSESLFKVSQGQEVEDLEVKLKDFYEPVVTQLSESVCVTTDLEQLLNETYQEQGYRWRLSCLNKSFGSLRKGDFGFIFARPETGKTTFLASEITSFLSQQAAVVFFNNEEQGNKVMLRIYQAYFGVTLQQLLANVQGFKNAFQEQVGERFKLIDSATTNRKDVEAAIGKFSPTAVVYDQIDKIKGFANDREDLRLGAIYQWARELAKNSHAAIGVCQADGTAEGVRYLTMEHVANAKTAKQAEADFILGIGKDRDPALDTVRYLNISKNKLVTDQDSLPELRHGRFEVLIEPVVARYSDTIEYR